MDTATLSRYRHLAEQFTFRVEAVDPQAWERQSPCEDWKAIDVLNHVTAGTQAFLAALDGAPLTGPPAPISERDPARALAAWQDARRRTEEALADPQTAGKVLDGPFGPMAYEDYVHRLTSIDLLVHTWDLARAAGLDESIDPATSAEALAFLTPLDSQLRAPGVFKPKLEPPAHADVATELLCFLGRKV